MIAAASSKTKQAIVKQVVASMNKTPLPPALAKQFQARLQMPERHLKRIKELYDKVMEETISPKEEAELDTLMDVAAMMDLIRAYALFGAPPTERRKSRK
jgi:7-keto-8-aminopelargonate synthetase-like enzyme